MEASLELQEYSNAIEGAICAFDQETDLSKVPTDKLVNFNSTRI